MIAASCEETARPMSGGLEFDVELAQHTVIDGMLRLSLAASDSMCHVRKTRKGEW